ncbi:MDR/zinc-dependent alcohol dehydrogenase-like family protein [Streptomyces bugieae]|uniref:Zinc-binding alcohol dehydrogenase family protein n=1 Tax=Streptomyces bugieae TaxID=3098223 RepID=A0ABU7NKZ2_9ACTN|nr:zinc-binding alcohol dehydrogenase family protein [Streptomyces sp. DSM 41528]
MTIETVPDPVVGTGEVVVDVVAAGVLPYAAEVFRGERRYLLTLPVIPGSGAVGRVRAVGPDSTRLRVGDWVLCDPTIRARDDALTPDITLQGLSARGEGGLRLQQHFGQGSFAEQLLVPTENVFPLGATGTTDATGTTGASDVIDAIDAADAGRWCALPVLLVPYGGLLAAGLQAGQTVLISGATGNFGSAAVAVALAMGAGCVVAPGRNEKMLGELERRFGSRIRTVRLSGDEAADRERMRAAAPAPIDVVLDLLPPSAAMTAVRAAVMTVREHGTVMLMGGVGMLGGDDLALPYPWLMRNNITVRGQWLCPRHANPQLIRLANSGQLDLRQFDVTAFDLADANTALRHAAAEGGRFSLTVIRPVREG